MSPLLIHGMHGLGDNIHQRAIIRALAPTHDLWLETSWPCIYADLPVKCIRRPVALRTQLKNAAREADKFFAGPAAHHTGNAVRVSYGRATIPPGGTILQAMFKVAGIPQLYSAADYRLPVPDEWQAMMEPYFRAWARPLCVYRPLTVRPEWRGSQVRNANAEDYAAIFAVIRDAFFVVSVADLEPSREWVVGPRLKADVELHKGELTFEMLAALFARADLVFTSSGFAAVLAPAVGTPCVSIQGGFEPSAWHADGARFAPWLGIDPINPCTCGTSACTAGCQKKIDVPAAIAKVRQFISDHCPASTTGAATRPLDQIFNPAEHSTTIHVRPHALRTLNPRLIRGNPLQIGARRGPIKA